MIQRYVAWCIGQKVMVDRSDNGDLCKYADVEAAIAAAVEAERERCAAICETGGDGITDVVELAIQIGTNAAIAHLIRKGTT